jgi:hypothetical protein
MTAVMEIIGFTEVLLDLAPVLRITKNIDIQYIWMILLIFISLICLG